jgi:outer membrane protein assembly factor BamD (BamD/ComL family)
MTLLRLAQDALAANPSRALALVSEHKSEYPKSALAQERELIAITALVRLGRSSEAEARAERFRKAYPGSAYERQLSKVLPP